MAYRLLSTKGLAPRRSLQPFANIPFFATRTYVTKQVSHMPASDNLSELKENAKDEVKTVVKDIASTISGANSQTSQTGHSEGALAAIAADVGGVRALGEAAGPVPRPALVLGAAGLLPYLGTSAATVYCAHQASLAMSATQDSTMDYDTALALLHHVENIQIGYGATILSFVGAIHWGFEFAKYGGTQGYPRYALGIAPLVAAMPTLLLPGTLALSAQWAAFAGTWYLDQRATTRGWTPKWYSAYRFWLTAIVGSSILLTLGGANYFGPEGKTSTTGRRLNEINQKAAEKLAEDHKSGNTEEGHIIKGPIGGDVDMATTSDAYVKLVNVEKKKAEEKKQKEEAEQKAKEEQQKAQEKAAADKKAKAKAEAEKKNSGEKTPGA